ncbi:MAG: TetR/AcrR family transcriptional regulator [Mycobacterium sp.]
MQRLTRAEARARTRDAVLDAATKLFLRDGFRATSLERIAEEAGYTHGAVYSNFTNKTAIGIAVVNALYEAEERRVLALIAAASERGRPWYEAVAQWSESGIGDRGWARLEAELAAFGSTDGALRNATADRYRSFRRRWGELATTAAQGAGIRLDLDAELLAAALIGLGLGIGIQRVADSTIPGSAFADILRAIATAATPGTADQAQ